MIMGIMKIAVETPCMASLHWIDCPIHYRINGTTHPRPLFLCLPFHPPPACRFTSLWLAGMEGGQAEKGEHHRKF